MMTIRPRFSIAAIMGFVFVFGVGLAAFRYPNKLWASFFFSITIGAMVIGSLGAVFHRGLPQKFWMGYAMCGWLYLLMNFGPWFETAVSPYLFTTAVLDLIYPHVAAPEQTAMLENGTQVFGLAGGFGASAPVNIWEHWTKVDSAAEQYAIANNFDVARSKPFQLIGHSLLALLFAYIGGLIARRFARLGMNPSG
jgi:hypothetical protein